MSEVSPRYIVMQTGKNTFHVGRLLAGHQAIYVSSCTCTKQIDASSIVQALTDKAVEHDRRTTSNATR